MMATEYVDKKSPELSANQLSEFLTATHTRKEGILRQARYIARESSAAPIRYSDVRRAIASYLADPSRNTAGIYGIREKFNNIVESAQAGQQMSDFTLSNARLSVEAIDAFLGSLNEIKFGGLSFALGDSHAPRVTIEGVGISVRPDVVVLAKNKKLEPIVGGLLMYFSKDVEKEEKADERKNHGLTAATLVHRYATDHLFDQGVPTQKLCISLDVFAKKPHQAPASNVRRRDNMEAACRSIALHWPTITPPEWWPL
jgi:hypothetical protein